MINLRLLHWRLWKRRRCCCQEQWCCDEEEDDDDDDDDEDNDDDNDYDDDDDTLLTLEKTPLQFTKEVATKNGRTRKKDKKDRQCRLHAGYPQREITVHHFEVGTAQN